MTENRLEWRVKDYEVLAETQNKAKVRVNALRPIKSRNGNVYTFPELLESARTMAGKLINVNHQNEKKIGDVKWAYANKKTEVMEVDGEINKEPYVYMVKNKDPRIRGWSVQADFRYAQCIHCPKKFESVQELKEHLIKEEHISNIDFEPKDIVFNGLALVLDPEVPGVPDTSYIAETVGTRSFNSLEEMVDTLEGEGSSWLLNKISNKNMEDYKKMKNVAVTQEQKPFAVSRSFTSQPAVKEAEPPKNTIKEQPIVITKELDKDKGETNIRITQDDGYGGKAIMAATLTETKALVIREAVEIGKLVFKEEECTPYEQCIKDGNSPDECNRRFKEVKERNESAKFVVATVNEIIDVVSKPITVDVPLPVIPEFKDDLSWKQEVQAVKETIAALPKDDDSAILSRIDDLEKREIPKYDDKPTLDEIATIKTRLADLETENKSLKEKCDSLEKRSNDEFATYKKDLMEYWTPRVENLEKENKSLKETVTKQEKTLAETKVLAENANDKIGPQFKGVTKGIDEPKKKQVDYGYKPGGV